MAWGIRSGWRYEAVEVVKETAKMVFYIDRGWGKPRETRQSKDSFLPWRGAEDDARALVAKLTSAKAEYERRRGAAVEWFDRRRAEILDAQGIEARRASDAEGGVVGDESPVGEADAPKG